MIAMAKNVNTTPDDVRASVASIYSDLLEKRRIEREQKEDLKREEREAREQQERSVDSGEDVKKTKKERRESELENWKEVIVGLTGDDLEYADDKKSKKKYKKWIDEGGDNVVLTPKPKKIKKQNFQKQFEPELNMLKTIVTDQNRFTADLQKRFNIAAGPATKDAQLPNKTLVELASVINAGRSNSLGVLREVGNLKKTIADLYMKQKKLDADTSGGGFSTTDVGLMGSNIAAGIFGDDTYEYIQSAPQQNTNNGPGPAPIQQQGNMQNVQSQAPVNVQQSSGPIQSAITVEAFDPATWGGPTLASDSMVYHETTPHEIVVEMNNETKTSRFKAIRNDTGEEIIGYPVPTSNLAKLNINETDKTVKGEFDEVYRLEIR